MIFDIKYNKYYVKKSKNISKNKLYNFGMFSTDDVATLDF